MNPVSINNRLLVEPYSGDRALKAKNAGGFAIVQQKVSIVGLKLVANASILVGNNIEEIKKGTVVYIKEELLFTQPWAQKIYESDGVEGKFIIVDLTHIEFADADTPANEEPT
jgi:hypothetical protein